MKYTGESRTTLWRRRVGLSSMRLPKPTPIPGAPHRVTLWERKKKEMEFITAAMKRAEKRKKAAPNAAYWELIGTESILSLLRAVARKIGIPPQEEADCIQESALKLWEVSGRREFAEPGWRWAVASNTMRWYMCRLYRRHEVPFFEGNEDEIRDSETEEMFTGCSPAEGRFGCAAMDPLRDWSRFSD